MSRERGTRSQGAGDRTSRGTAVLAVAVLVAALLAGAALLLARGHDDRPGVSSYSGVDPDVYAAELLVAADAAHTAAGLPAWRDAPCVGDLARDRARALVGDHLTHAPLEDVLAACVPLTTAAENLSRGAAPAAEVVEAWQRSPGHRANLEDPTLTHARAGCVHDGDELVCSLVLVGP
ncbi:CAP domain-containing protein [Cellulomonas palmilytica]|uniref:CAP domain-containing protein n=1 Tax=Cellulomonas palmilytica TaxID=2608402 RepID=UPI001F4467CF|nr:CAP domain-containing protein [Cellulomonas palmilytica]UJP41004.1 hypothetical protein F1D97_05965 [Cellulomonas palmilytica]